MTGKIKKNKKIPNTKIVGVVGLVILLFIGGLLYFNTFTLNTFLFGSTLKKALTPHTAHGLPLKRTIAIGLSAILPKIDPATITGPTFSLDDARAYITTHPFHKGITTTGQPSSINSIYFATDKQVTEMTKSDPG